MLLLETSRGHPPPPRNNLPPTHMPWHPPATNPPSIKLQPRLSGVRHSRQGLFPRTARHRRLHRICQRPQLSVSTAVPAAGPAAAPTRNTRRPRPTSCVPGCHAITTADSAAAAFWDSGTASCRRLAAVADAAAATSERCCGCRGRRCRRSVRRTGCSAARNGRNSSALSVTGICCCNGESGKRSEARCTSKGRTPFNKQLGQGGEVSVSC